MDKFPKLYWYSIKNFKPEDWSFYYEDHNETGICDFLFRKSQIRQRRQAVSFKLNLKSSIWKWYYTFLFRMYDFPKNSHTISEPIKGGFMMNNNYQNNQNNRSNQSSQNNRTNQSNQNSRSNQSNQNSQSRWPEKTSEGKPSEAFYIYVFFMSWGKVIFAHFIGWPWK